MSDSELVKKWTVNDDGTLTETSVSSMGDLENDSVYIIVDESKRKIFIWKGEQAPVRRKFISAKTAQQMRQEGLSRAQAGRQMAFDGGSNMATSMGGQQQQPNLYGSNTPQQNAFTPNSQNAFTPNYNPSFNSFQPTGMNTTPGGLTYNTSPSFTTQTGFQSIGG